MGKRLKTINNQENYRSARSRAGTVTLTPEPAINRLALCIRAACLPTGLILGLATPVLAGPEGGQVVGGKGAINKPDTSTTNINQQSQNMAIDWDSYNVNKNETVNYRQPNKNAHALNRIHDRNASQILGTINANGRVTLLNSNGIFFGPSARVNVNSLIASGHDMSVEDFMNGRYEFKTQPGQSGGAVINQGVLEAATGGSISLLGGNVQNEGLIVATAGQVNLVAGDQITMDFDGDGLMRFSVDKEVLANAEDLDSAITNTGEIRADGGQVLLSGRAAQDVFKHVVNNDGVVKAGRIENRGGKIVLAGSGGSQSSVVNTGTLDASAIPSPSQGEGQDGGEVRITADTIKQRGTINADSTGADGGTIELIAEDTNIVSGDAQITATALPSPSEGEGQDGGDQTSTAGKGGSVNILGDKVALLDASMIDVSGELGGGEVLIGGDFQGKNLDIRNASKTYVGSNASITADAVADGDGGRVIVWADEWTKFYGDISARGGSEGGDGGFVEVSGKDYLKFDGMVDVSAAQGVMGTLLLDPRDITITDATTTDDTKLPQLLFADDNGGGQFSDDFTISNDAIDSQIANIILQANRNIFQNSDAPINLSNDGISLTLQAGHDITLNAAITTRGGGLYLEADTPHSNDGSGSGCALCVPADGDGALSINGNVDVTAGGTFAGADITFIGADFAIDTVTPVSINAGGGNINIAPSVDATPITLGSGILSDAELDTLNSSGITTVGFAVTAGSDGAGTGTLNRTAGSLTIDQAITVASATAAEFRLRALDGITLNESLTTNQTTDLNADTDASDNVGTLTVSDSFTLDTTGNSLSVTANDLSLGATPTGILNSGAAAATILDSDGSGIGLGDSVATDGLNISGAEMQNITATGLMLNTGGNVLVDNITATNSDNISGTLTLDALGSITFQTVASTFNALDAQADDRIAVNVDLTSDVGDLALDGDADDAAGANDDVQFAAGVTLASAGNMTLDATTGGMTGAGALTLNASNGITINDSLTVGGIFNINANTTTDGNGLLNVTNGNLSTTAGNHDITILAEDLDIAAGATIDSGAGTIRIRENENDGLALGAATTTNGMDVSNDELGRISTTGTLFFDQHNASITLEDVTNTSAATVRLRTNAAPINFNGLASSFESLNVESGWMINVNADLTTTTGDLRLVADQNNDGFAGNDFVGLGDGVTLTSAGDITLDVGPTRDVSNVEAGGNLILDAVGDINLLQDMVWTGAATNVISMTAGGTVFVDGTQTLDTTGAGQDLAIEAADVDLAGSVNTGGTAVSITAANDGDATVGNAIAGELNLSDDELSRITADDLSVITTNTGAITIKGTTAGNSTGITTLTLNGASGVTIGAAGTALTNSIDITGNTTLAGDLTTSGGNVVFNSSMLVDGTRTIDSGNGQTTGTAGFIQLLADAGSVDTTSDTLMLDARGDIDDGAVDVQGDIGAGTVHGAAANDLTGFTIFGAQVDLAAVEVTSGNIAIAGSNIDLNGTTYQTNTSGAISFTGPVDLDAGAETTSVTTPGSGADTISFSSTIDDAGNDTTLQLNANGANVTVGGAIGATSAVAALNIDGFDISVNDIGNGGAGVTGLTDVNATNQLIFTGTIYNANQQNYTAAAGENLLINGGALTNFTSSGDNITFNTAGLSLSTDSDLAITTGSGGGNIDVVSVDGGETVSLTAGTGTVTASGAIGGSTPVTLLDIVSADTVNLQAVTTSGTADADANGDTITIGSGSAIATTLNLNGDLDTAGAGTGTATGGIRVNASSNVNLEAAGGGTAGMLALNTDDGGAGADAAITLTGGATVQSATAFEDGLTLDAGTDTVDFSGVALSSLDHLNVTAGTLTAGAITTGAGDGNAGTGIRLTSTGTVTLTGDLATTGETNSGDIVFAGGGNIVLDDADGEVVLNTDGGGTDANVILGAVIEPATAGADSLTVTAGGADVTVNAGIGATDPLDQVNLSGNLITTNDGGSLRAANDITLTAAGALSLDDNLTITGTAGTINLTGTGITLVTDTNDGMIVSAIDGSIDLDAGTGALTLQDENDNAVATGSGSISLVQTTGSGNIVINAADLVIEDNDPADKPQIDAGGSLSIAANGGGTLGLGDDAIIATSDFKLSDSELNELSGSGTLKLGDSTSGRILLDMAGALTSFSGNLALETGSFITDNSAGTAFSSAGTLTLTSAGTVGIDNTTGNNTDGTLGIDVNTLNVVDTAGNAMNVTESGAGGNTTYNLGSAASLGAVTVAQNTNNALIQAIDSGGTVSITASSATGSIVDHDNDSLTDITADTVDLNATAGIGASEPLELAVATVTANSAGGDITLSNESATNAGASTLITSGADISFTQTGTGQLLVGTVSTDGAGAITLNAEAGMVLTGGVTTDGGNITLNADTDGAATGTGLLELNSSGALTTGGGDLFLTAADFNYLSGSNALSLGGGALDLSFTRAGDMCLGNAAGGGGCQINLDNTDIGVLINATNTLDLDNSGSLVFADQADFLTLSSLTLTGLGIDDLDGAYGIGSMGSLDLTLNSTGTIGTSTDGLELNQVASVGFSAADAVELTVASGGNATTTVTGTTTANNGAVTISALDKTLTVGAAGLAAHNTGTVLLGTPNAGTDIILNGNVGAATNTTATVLATGSITGTGTVSGTTVQLFAEDEIGADGSEIATAADNLTAQSNTAGDVYINEADAVTLDTISAASGLIDIDTLAAGDIELDGTVDANGTVAITTFNGAILDVDGNGSIDGSTVTLDTTAGSGSVGTAANRLTITGTNLVVDAVGEVGLSTGVDLLNVDTSGGAINIDNAATSAVNVASLTSGGAGSIAYDQTGNQSLTLTSVSAANGDITLTNAGGTGADILIGLITADTTDDTVSITTPGGMDDLAPNPDRTTDVVAATTDLDADEGIGTAAHVDLNGGTLTLDSTGGDVSVSNNNSGSTTINSLTAGGTENVTFNQSTAGTTNFDSAINLGGTLSLSAAGGSVLNFNNDLTANTLATGSGSYSIALNNGGGAQTTSITTDTTFNNTDGVQIGNAAGDTATFANGLDTTVGATTLGGTVETINASMDLPATSLVADTTLASGSGTLNITSIAGAGRALTLQDAAATGTVTITDNVTLGSLTTGAGGYAIAMLGDSNTIGGSTSFTNTGNLTLGNNINDLFTFTGGIDTTAVNQLNFNGEIRSDGSINIGDMNVAGDSILTATDINFANGTGSITGGSDTRELMLRPGTADILQGQAALDLSIDTGAGPGDLNLGANEINALNTWGGHSVIGGTLTLPSSGTSLADATDVTINTDTLTINSDIGTASSGNFTFLAASILMNADVNAGGSGGNEVSMVASGGGTSSSDGDIATGGAGQRQIQGDSAILVAANGLQGADSSLNLDLDGGEFTLAVAAGQEATSQRVIDANSNASSATDLPGNLSSVISNLLNLNVGQVFVNFFNPALQLFALEDISFIDTGLFQEDLSLFGTIGEGIALELEQCEEIEGCAPNVTMEELDSLIKGLETRIGELEKRIADAPDEATRQELEQLLADYKAELEEFMGYREELQTFLTGPTEGDELGDDLGEDFVPGEQELPEDEATDQPFTSPEQLGGVDVLARMLETIQSRVEFLESLRGDAERRAELGERTGIDLTEEALDRIIENTRKELQFIESLMQDVIENSESRRNDVFSADAGGPPVSLPSIGYNAGDLMLRSGHLPMDMRWF